MVLIIKHNFTSAIPDDPAAVLAGEVTPSNWNAAHTLTGSIVWGEITGTLSSQTDLQSALDGKQSTLTTGNLTANSPLSFNNTRQVIGGAAAVSIADAAADGSTKGAAAFTASDFNSSSGLISIDYTNGQAASGTTKGFLTSVDWTTFNNKFALPSLTSGSVLFSNGTTISQDNANFFRYNVSGTQALGIGTNTPTSTGTGYDYAGTGASLLSVRCSGSVASALLISDLQAGFNIIHTAAPGDQKWFQLVNANGRSDFRSLSDNGMSVPFYFLSMNHANGRVGIGTVSPSVLLDVNGAGNFAGDVTGSINPYGSNWNGSARFATEDAIYDKIETIASDVLFDHFTDAGNTGTGEDDLYSDTIAAGQLSANGQKIIATYQGIFSGAAASTQDLKIYFGGTMIYDSGALSIGVATNSWTAELTLIRVSSSVVRCSVAISTDFATFFPYSKYTEVTGLTLANTQVLKLTGEAAGVGAANNQIVAKLGYVEFKPAA